MALTISHDETERLALELARETGEPVSQVILEALQHRAHQLRERRTRALTLTRIQAAARRCAALPDRDTLPADQTLGDGPDGTFEPWSSTVPP